MKPFFLLATLLFTGFFSSAQEASSKVSQSVSFRLMDLSVMDMASVLPAVLSTNIIKNIPVQSNGQWMINKETTPLNRFYSSTPARPSLSAKTIYTLSKA